MATECPTYIGVFFAMVRLATFPVWCLSIPLLVKREVPMEKKSKISSYKSFLYSVEGGLPEVGVASHVGTEEVMCLCFHFP